VLDVKVFEFVEGGLREVLECVKILKLVQRIIAKPTWIPIDYSMHVLGLRFIIASGPTENLSVVSLCGQ
jgi:hypothetical protein